MDKSMRLLFMRVARKLRKELEVLVTVNDPKTGCPLVDGWLPDLGGACIYGSIIVFMELKRLGRRPLMVYGDGHWFSHCDGYLIDITASQFGMKDVEVFSIAEVRDQDRFWVPIKVTKTIRGMDPVFIQYAEDIELARKIIRQGKV